MTKKKCINCKYRKPSEENVENPHGYTGTIFYSVCDLHGWQTFAGNVCPEWELLEKKKIFGPLHRTSYYKGEVKKK